MIKHHSEEVLALDPGKYSVDPNKLTFQPQVGNSRHLNFFSTMICSQEWNYAYYCRIYHPKNSMENEELRIFDDPNQHCFSNRSISNYAWQADPLLKLTASSVEIFSKSFKPNETYQFMIHMTNKENPALQSIGYLFVQVENTISPSIIIG